MSRPCSTCEHPDRATIEIGLANGVALRVLAKRYGLDPSQLSRHRTNHMSEELLARLRTRGARSDEELAKIRDVESKNLLDNLTYQRARFYRIADRAASIGDDAGETRALAEARKSSELIAKLLGDIAVGSVHVTNNNIAVMPEWHGIRTAIVRALRPFPGAHAAVIDALQAIETQALPALEHAAA